MKNLLVILDPGHGIETKGKRSPDGRLLEWKWAREFAEKLKTVLDAEDGIKCHILVPEEKDVSLGNRCLRANTIYNNFTKLGWDVVLISIHVNAAKSDGKWHDARGFTVWVYTNGSKKSRKLGYIFGSQSIVRQLTGNRWIPSDNYFTANFAIVKNTYMPAVLCENLFQDNIDDVEFLLSEDGVNKLLDMYVYTIKSYREYINKEIKK